MTDLISQGSYGCIFRPGFTCKGSPTKKGYITKIQKIASTSKKETKLGKKIKKIDNYKDYFAPILKTCEVSLAKMEEDKLKKCEFINEDDTMEYESNKLRYVGKDTLSKYILNTVDRNPKQLIRILVDTYKNLLVGFDKLNAAGIVHMDVKENNIMIDDNTKNPIIIDFGLSSEITDLNKNNYKDTFFVYGPDYGPWCIDICMLTYMANELESEIIPPGMLGFLDYEEKKAVKWQDGMVTKEKISKVITDFIKKNTVMTDLLSEKQRSEYNKKLHDYFNGFVGKKWAEVAESLLENVSTWDSYALSATYLQIIEVLELKNTNMDLPKWRSYKKILEDIILSRPDERDNSSKIIEKINTIFTNVSSSENKKLMKLLDGVLLSNEKKNMIKKNILTTMQNNLQRETKVYQALR
jgi:serine/threonine protein kinase